MFKKIWKIIGLWIYFIVRICFFNEFLWFYCVINFLKYIVGFVLKFDIFYYFIRLVFGVK